jgi:hypothetical protein
VVQGTVAPAASSERRWMGQALSPMVLRGVDGQAAVKHAKVPVRILLEWTPQVCCPRKHQSLSHQRGAGAEHSGGKGLWRVVGAGGGQSHSTGRALTPLAGTSGRLEQAAMMQPH